VKEEQVMHLDPPSASIAIIRIKDTRLEHYVLGDCSILIEMKNGTYQKIKDDRVTQLDNKVIKKMIQLHDKKSISVVETNPLVKHLIVENRKKKNTQGGYWILTVDGKGIEEGDQGEISSEGLSKMCLLTDGFSEYYEVLGLAPSYKEFLDEISLADLEAFYSRIRETQCEDKYCNKFPRIKPKDDATIVYMEFD